MESVLNNLLLLVENNCNEGTYVKAGAIIKEVYELQNNNDSEDEGGGSVMRISTNDYCLLKQTNIDLKNKVRELESINEDLEEKVEDLEKKIDLERKDNNENRIELLEEIRELNKQIRKLDW